MVQQFVVIREMPTPGSDAQLAREVEFALPRELSKKDNIKLAREFVKAELVEKGMIADLNVHWDIGKDGRAKPHAHVMLTMREVTKDGFGEIGRASCRERVCQSV